MFKKPKFKPEITRIKLNPGQAVLFCDCYSSGFKNGSTLYPDRVMVCQLDYSGPGTKGVSPVGVSYASTSSTSS